MADDYEHTKFLSKKTKRGKLKDVEEVIESVHGAGISLKVARLIPIGVCKG
jgi:RNA-splicing ligase RtcB